MSKEEKIQDYPFLHFPLCEPKGPRRREPEQQYTKLGKGGNRPYSPVAAHLSRDKKMQSITEKLRSARKTSGRHYSLYAQRPYPRRLYFAVVRLSFLVSRFQVCPSGLGRYINLLVLFFLFRFRLSFPFLTLIPVLSCSNSF